MTTSLTPIFDTGFDLNACDKIAEDAPEVIGGAYRRNLPPSPLCLPNMLDKLRRLFDFSLSAALLERMPPFEISVSTSAVDDVFV